MFINRASNLQKRTTISISKIVGITLLIAVINVDYGNDIKKVDILRGECTSVFKFYSRSFLM
jgi:hypothetical protein